ncbi:MAG: hypothetical protein HFJ65_02295 [Eggerthellaceae bacterium]|nr:hypothetical protein [Eggerthellaceae bacterium]
MAADSMAPYEMASPKHLVDEAAPDEVKQCPVCKAKVFADMDTCYECMYLFGSKPELEASNSEEGEASEAPALDEPPSEALPEADDEPVVASPLPKATMTFGGGCKEEDEPCSTEPKAQSEDVDLLAELLVELHGFLGEFLLKRGIDVKQL